MKEKRPIPVVLFVYNRSTQLQKTLEGIKNNSITELYIFSDGPKDKSDLYKVNAVRKQIDAIDWAHVHKVYRKHNLGLKVSVIKGLDQVFSKHEAAVILEDDIYIPPCFYSYMVQCLEAYKDTPHVAGVTGLRYPFATKHLQDDPYDVFLSPRISSWGWGTWRSVWRRTVFDSKKLSQSLAKVNPSSLAWGGIDLPDAIAEFQKGNLTNSWAIPYFINMIINQDYFVWPKKNLVANTGMVVGTHANEENEPSWKLRWETKHKTTWNLPSKKNLEINSELIDDFLSFFLPENLYRISLKKRLRQTKQRSIRQLSTLKSGMLKSYLRPALSKAKRRLVGLNNKLRKSSNLGGYDLEPGPSPILRSKDTVRKQALLSYLVQPIIDQQNGKLIDKFSNDGLAISFPRALGNLGYATDIINWDDSKFISSKEYDLLISHGALNYNKIAKLIKTNPKVTYIYFSTGSYWKFHNTQEDKRLQAFSVRHNGKQLPRDRYITHSEEEANRKASGVICLGNKAAAETYKDISPIVLNIPVGCYPDKRKFKKNLEFGRKSFFFFSGAGNMHKGLDLLLEAFAAMPEYNLHIATFLDKEFEEHYAKELNLKNIHLHGFVELRSREFYEIVDSCNFVIFPSCSEGSPGSVVECMMNGLIPIVSYEAHIDVGSSGVIINNVSITNLKKQVRYFSALSKKELQKRSKAARKIALKDHSPTKFLKELQRSVKHIVGASNDN